MKKRFIQLLLNRYNFISSDELGRESLKLLNIYCNRANKKLDISKDIEIFSELAGKYVAEGVTMLHYDRLYTLFQAIGNILSLKGDVIELGVFQGGSLKFMREVMDKAGSPQNLYGFDTFEGHAVITEHDGGVHKKEMFSTGGIEEIATYVNDPRVQLIKGDVSQTISPFLAQSSGIALAHFDMDVYQPTADALPLVYEKLLPGGIILFDDYGFISCPGVKRAADDFLMTVHTTHFHLMTGQMIIVK